MVWRAVTLCRIDHVVRQLMVGSGPSAYDTVHADSGHWVDCLFLRSWARERPGQSSKA